MIKRLAIIFLLTVIFCCSGYRKPYKYTIDAGKDAFYHNNVGLNYLKDRIYYAAIQEFKIAISLNPETQASAVYYNNLGECYMKIGYPDLAQDCFERAVKLYSLNFQYFLNQWFCSPEYSTPGKALPFRGCVFRFPLLLSGVFPAAPGFPGAFSGA